MAEGNGKRPRGWWALAAVLVPLFSVVVNTTAVNAALPSIGNELDASVSSLSWIVNVYLLVCASMVVAGGELGDMFGRRKMFLLGIAFFLVASVVIATASSTAQLIGGRAIQGLGAAFILPGSMSLIRVNFEGGQRVTALAIWGAIAGLGFALGPVIGGAFTDSLGWEWVWWSNLPILAAGIVLVLWSMGESKDEGRETAVDFAGLALLILGLFALVLALDQGRIWGWTSGKELIAYAVAALCLVGFGIVEPRVKSPLVHFGHFRERVFIASNVGTFLVTAVLIGLLYIGNLFLQTFVLHDYSALTTGLALMPMSMLLFVVSLFVGDLLKRFGPQLPITIGFLLIAGGFVAMSFQEPSSSYLSLLPGLVLLGVGLGLSFGPTSGIGVNAVPEDKAGEASGIINMSRYLGGAIGVAVLSIVYATVSLNQLNDKLSTERVPIDTEHTLDRLLSGSSDAAEKTLATLPASTKSDFVEATRQATVDAFNTSARVAAVMALIGAVACAFLLRKARAPVQHHEHHKRAAPGATVVTGPPHPRAESST